MTRCQPRTGACPARDYRIGCRKRPWRITPWSAPGRPPRRPSDFQTPDLTCCAARVFEPQSPSNRPPRYPNGLPALMAPPPAARAPLLLVQSAPRVLLVPGMVRPAARRAWSDDANRPLGHVGQDPTDLKFDHLWQQNG